MAISPISQRHLATFTHYLTWEYCTRDFDQFLFCCNKLRVWTRVKSVFCPRNGSFACWHVFGCLHINLGSRQNANEHFCSELWMHVVKHCLRGKLNKVWYAFCAHPSYFPKSKLTVDKSQLCSFVLFPIYGLIVICLFSFSQDWKKWFWVSLIYFYHPFIS